MDTNFFFSHDARQPRQLSVRYAPPQPPCLPRQPLVCRVSQVVVCCVGDHHAGAAFHDAATRLPREWQLVLRLREEKVDLLQRLPRLPADGCGLAAIENPP